MADKTEKLVIGNKIENCDESLLFDVPHVQQGPVAMLNQTLLMRSQPSSSFEVSELSLLRTLYILSP